MGLAMKRSFAIVQSSPQAKVETCAVCRRRDGREGHPTPTFDLHRAKLQLEALQTFGYISCVGIPHGAIALPMLSQDGSEML